VVPIASFPRYMMPIHWTVGSTPRVFTSHGNRIIPLSGVVMIAKVEGDKGMTVIEKIGECLYSMCSLRKDLKVKDVRMVAKGVKDVEMPSQEEIDVDEMQVDGNEWWRTMMIRPSQLKERHEITLNMLIQDGGSIEYFLTWHLSLTLDQRRNERQASSLSLPYSHVTNLNSPQTQATLPHHKPPFHKRPHPSHRSISKHFIPPKLPWHTLRSQQYLEHEQSFSE